MYSTKKTLRRIAALTAALTAVVAISSGSGVQAKIEAKVGDKCTKAQYGKTSKVGATRVRCTFKNKKYTWTRVATTTATTIPVGAGLPAMGPSATPHQFHRQQRNAARAAPTGILGLHKTFRCSSQPHTNPNHCKTYPALVIVSALVSKPIKNIKRLRNIINLIEFSLIISLSLSLVSSSVL